MRGHKRELVIALALGLALTILFRRFSDLDLLVSGLFYDGRTFPLSDSPTLRFLREIGILVPRVVIFALLGIVIMKLVRPLCRMLIPPRAIIFLLVSVALGPGLITNLILKDHWDRSRPNDIVQFGGHATFSKAWTIGDQCPDNCSFVSGEAASSFWTVAIAALVPAGFRMGALIAAFGFGFAVSLLRVAFGGHFLSDVLLAGVITYIVVWLCFRWIYHTDFPDDRRLEGGLEAFSRWLSRGAGSARRRLGAAGRRTRRLIACADLRPIVAR